MLSWRFNFPPLKQFRAASRDFSKSERLIFLASFTLLLAGVIGFFISINNKYSVVVPAHGGKWREGIVGSPSFVNPLLAVSDADRDTTTLIYSGLMRADGHGGLVPDLAESFEISDDGLSYTFHLKDNLTWHDGQPLTSADIVFTIETAKNPALKSPVRANWEGVTIDSPDERTVKLTLANPYAPFIENTTLGIIPKHIWSGILPEQFTFSAFNHKPIGSGPYQIASTPTNSSGIITKFVLRSFDKYAGGEPNISTFEIKFYPTEQILKADFQKREIDGISVAVAKDLGEIGGNNIEIHELTLPRIFGVFFNQNRAPIFTEKNIRLALDLAVDKKRIVNEVFAGHAEIANSPIPPGTFGDFSEDADSKLVNDDAARPIDRANSTLKSAGWVKDPETGILTKKTKKETKTLSFTLSTANTPDLAETGELLKSMWAELGVNITIKLFEFTDLNQQVIRPREYDALLFGEVVGRDPDPFAFWHSSQMNDPGLNIALYANSTVDKLLETARKTINEDERKQKYIEFQKEIADDVPAVFLYSPSYLYATTDGLKGFETENITVPPERFARVHSWHLKTKKVLKYFAN